MSLLTNLENHWKLDEASGSRSDSRGSDTLGDHNSTISGTGKINSAADFENGSAQYLDCLASSSWQSANDHALSLWFNAESFLASSSTYCGLVSVGKDSDVILSFSLIDDGTALQRLRFEVQNSGGSYQNVTYGVSLIVNRWYHLVGELNSSTLRIYVDGSPAAEASFSGTIKTADGSTHRLAVGRDWFLEQSDRYIDGRIDELSHWSRGVTPAEVLQINNNNDGLQFQYYDPAATAVARKSSFLLHPKYKLRRAVAA